MSGAKGEVSATDKARKGVVRAHREPPTCKETGAEMLARQQQEVKQQQNKEVVLKKAAAKGSKTERKAKKKQAEEETARLDVKLKTRHAKELASLGYKIEDDRVSNGLDGSVRAVSGISVTESQSGKVCRSQKWREKRAQKEADREQRIQEEQSSIISDRVLENQNLEHKLQPLGFSLHEIKPDGHCLYRAVENQLSLYPGIAPQYSYQQLREIAAAYMRSHAEDFLPFFLDGSDNEIESEETRQKSFEKYCREIESTASWGGQLELGALAHTLRKHIVIYFGNFPDVEMGKEYEFESLDGLSLNPSIRISYHQHAFGLGEHYNSVIPAQARKSFEFCT